MRHIVLVCSLYVFACSSLMAADPADVSPQVPSSREDNVVIIDVANGDELQSQLFRYSGTGKCVRLKKGSKITCGVRVDEVGDEKSIHALLIPEQVRLDLNESTLRLDLQSNSYGVRMSNHSAIGNGTIRIVASEGKGSQAIWHSGVSVGAAYGDGGTVEKPGRFSTVSHFVIEDLVFDQPFAAAAIQLMSEACHGTIRNILIQDSDKALLGIGLDWGTVGPITTEDKEVPRMRRLWEQRQIYSTHPHDILIENIMIGKLNRNVDGNDAGIRMSACHRIKISNVDIESAASAVMIVGGDFGYEFARNDLRPFAHQGYVVENVRIDQALRYGIILNGLADNVWRSRKNFGYDTVLDPAHPGLDRPIIRNVKLSGGGATYSQGIYGVAMTGATLEDVSIEYFALGVHIEDWVRGMLFNNCRITNNVRNRSVGGTTEPAVNVVFDPMP